MTRSRYLAEYVTITYTEVHPTTRKLAEKTVSVPRAEAHAMVGLLFAKKLVLAARYLTPLGEKVYSGAEAYAYIR